MAGPGGTEMQRAGFTDEEDERLAALASERHAKKSVEPDWDKIFAYKTLKIVRIRDRKLGALYWSIVTCVIMYIIMVAFGIEGKHTVQDAGIGTVITKFKGKGFTEDGKVFDGVDLRFPVIEPSGAFIMTKRVLMKEQTMGECVDMDSPKHSPCDPGLGEVQEGDFCKVRTWCPSLGDSNADKHPPGSRIEVIHGLENAQLQVMAGIAFPHISDQFYVMGSSKGMTNDFKNITLGGLLSLARPPETVEEMKHVGALIGLSFYWRCDVTQECEPEVVIKRLDGGQGFVQKRVHHGRNAAGQETREASYMYGVRILVDSSGIGQKVSFVLIVIQIGSGIALLRTASMAADFLMLKLYEPKRSQAYYRCKITETKDYSDLQDRINLIQDQKSETEELLGGRNRGGAAANVPLGLGPGGRGGMASAILRGRSGAASSSS